MGFRSDKLSQEDRFLCPGPELNFNFNFQQQQARHGSQVTGHEGSTSPPTLNSPSPTHYTKENNHESSSNEGTTPKAKKKPERRVHRTWKHFYQEVRTFLYSIRNYCDFTLPPEWPKGYKTISKKLFHF